MVRRPVPDPRDPGGRGPRPVPGGLLRCFVLNIDDSLFGDRRYVARVNAHGWTVTIDAAYPPGVVELTDESIHRLLDAIEQYRGALNVGQLGHRGLTVTLTIESADLDDANAEDAAARAHAIVREHFPTIGVGDDWVLKATEVSHDDAAGTMHLLPVVVAEYR